MYDEHQQLDEDLMALAQALRSGDVMMSCIQLAEFALKLDRIMRREERALAFAVEQHPATRNPLPFVHGEHASLRWLIGQIANALDRSDEHIGLEAIAKLRSVLLVHLVKEETLRPLLEARA